MVSQICSLVWLAHLVEVGALGWPHGGGAQAENEGGRDEGVELRVELGGHVGRVAEDAHHQRPLDLKQGTIFFK